LNPVPANPDKLSLEALRRGLATRIIGRALHVYDLVISTNDVVWELAARGADEGTVVFADGQTEGRGRLGRSWWSPRGKGLWMSVLLRPPFLSPGVPMTTIIGALAATDAIRRKTRLPAMIRWPNDVLVEGKKVAGVLVEARHRPSGHELVLGIGIDVNVRRGDFPEDIRGMASALSEVAGEPVDRTALARELLAALDRWYQVKLDRDLGSVNRAWRERSATLGSRIVLEEHDRRYEGTVIDVDVRFGIALRLGRGSIRHFRGEHVTVLEHG
jgi:BirA family biotin operon repressor/biotin-[acetyl-CoA-carboxylase] ligase